MRHLGKLPKRLTNLKLRGKVAEPALSTEVYRVFAFAFEQVGPIRPRHLLLALAQAGQIEGIAPDQLS